MPEGSKISVVIVDDSSVIRRVLKRMVDGYDNIEVVGTAGDGRSAVEEAQNKKPDIMLLDVEMPVQDGLSALPQILKASPNTKVIMCSSLTAKGAETTIKAMSLGAVECVLKPRTAEDTEPNSHFQKSLLRLISHLTRPGRVAAERHAPSAPGQDRSIGRSGERGAFSLVETHAAYAGRPAIVAIGSSTGGPQALFKVLKQVGRLPVPIVITQHMPATFTKILAQHIAQQTGLSAFEGEDGMRVENGMVYVAPGGKHMVFRKDGMALKIALNDGPPENFCKPAVDPMLRSLLDLYDKRVLSVILTGMGQDGMAGAQALHKAGGRIMAQDEESSVVWGMPGAVAMAGICTHVTTPERLGDLIKDTF